MPQDAKQEPLRPSGGREETLRFARQPTVVRHSAIQCHQPVQRFDNLNLSSSLTALKPLLHPTIKAAPLEVQLFLQEVGFVPVHSSIDRNRAEYERGGKTGFSLSELKHRVSRWGDPTPENRVAVDGNPAVGTIHILGQSHLSSMSSNPAATTRLAIGGLQGAHYRYLLAQPHPVHVFFEALPEPINQSGINGGMKRSYILEHFETGVPEQFSESHKYCLSDGAGLILLEANPNATIQHGVFTKDQMDRITRLFAKARVAEDTAVEALLACDVREQLAMRNCMEFLATNPGQTVYLQFGSGHKWGPECLGSAETGICLMLG